MLARKLFRWYILCREQWFWLFEIWLWSRCPKFGKSSWQAGLRLLVVDFLRALDFHWNFPVEQKLMSYTLCYPWGTGQRDRICVWFQIETLITFQDSGPWIGCWIALFQPRLLASRAETTFKAGACPYKYLLSKALLNLPQMNPLKIELLVTHQKD